MTEVSIDILGNLDGDLQTRAYPEPWHSLPVVPSCEGCGACCEHMGLPPFDSYDDDDFDFATLPDGLKRELEAAWDRQFGPDDMAHDVEGNPCRIPRTLGSACLWLDLDTKKCRHYEHRPVCCRRFEPGNDICLEDRELAGVSESPAVLAKELFIA